MAARFLIERGLTVLARNLRSRLGEIDLIAQDGATLVFVEVKARQGGTGDPPQAAVDRRKQTRLGRLAQGYLSRARLTDRRCRFDVVAVTFAPGGAAAGAAPGVAHFPGAFGIDGWSP